MELYVVRHGQTIVNVLKLINSRNWIGLNRKGKKQAKLAGKQMENIKIDLVFCSPLRRTKQTCRLVTQNKIKPIYEERLLERNARSLELKDATKLNREIWYDISQDVVYKDSEGFRSVLTRVINLLEELKEKYPDKSILLVTHGDVCKAIYAYFNKITDPIQINLSEQENCEIRKYVY